MDMLLAPSYSIIGHGYNGVKTCDARLKKRRCPPFTLVTVLHPRKTYQYQVSNTASPFAKTRKVEFHKCLRGLDCLILPLGIKRGAELFC